MDYPPPVPAETDSGAAEAAVPDEASGEPVVDAAVRTLPGGGGVYLLTDEAERPVLLSAAADLRRALRSRLLEVPAEDMSGKPAPSRRKARLGEIVRRIRWQPAHSVFETDFLYLCIARRVIADTYLKNLSFGPAWFVQVQPDDPFPHFVAGKVLADRGSRLGPFPTQPDANRLIQVLEDAFDLCRYHHILEQAPHGTPCAYYEMGKSLAPCSGEISMDQYRTMIRSALAFARGDREPFLRQWQEQMQRYAGEWAYEKAAAVKQRIERSRTVEQAAFRHVRPIEDFNYLIVQRGKGRTTVKPFVVRRGTIAPGEAVRIKKVADIAVQWIAAVREEAVSSGGESGDLQFQSEQIWLVSHYLFKNEPPGLFLHASTLDDPESIALRVRERFERASSETETPT